MNIMQDLLVVRSAWKNLCHSSGAAEQQESRWLERIIADYERQPTDEHADRVIESAARHHSIQMATP